MPYTTRTRSTQPATLPATWTIAGSPAVCDTRSRILPQTQEFVYSFRGDAEGDYSRMTGPELRRNMRSEYLSRYDTGHEFTAWKLRFDPRLPMAGVSSAYVANQPPNYASQKVYAGPLYPTWTSSVRPPTSGATEDLLNSFGREAIAKTIPTAPEAGLASAIIELREGIPRLSGMVLSKALQQSRSKPKAIGSAAGEELLNIEFGLKPLVNDIAKLAVALSSISARIESLERGSGMITRKHAGLPTTEEYSVSSFGSEPHGILMPRANVQNMETNFFSSSGMTVTLQKHTKQDVWFSGAYTYWLGQGDELSERLKRYQQLASVLLGGSITPEVVWAVTPWSWLIDWFGDLDVFFRNLQLAEADRLLLRYGYVMCTTETTWTKVVSGITPRSGSNFPTTLSSSWISTVKQRRKATPYGFGLDVGGFSNRRWSILSALGMTKGERSLRP